MHVSDSDETMVWARLDNILIFVDRRDAVDLLFTWLCDAGYFLSILHGGINHIDRDYSHCTMIDFEDKVKSTLICTGVGSRG